MAKTTVYWPGIDADIEDWVQRCTAFLATKPNQKREPLLPHKVPDGPWQKIGADFFDFEGKKFLLVIDYFSKFIFVEKVTTTTVHYQPVSQHICNRKSTTDTDHR